MFVPSPIVAASRAALAIRRRQFEAVLDPVKTVNIAAAIVGEKINMEKHSKTVERNFLARLRIAKTTDEIRHTEAKSAQIWWSQWTGFEMRFKGPKVPAEWHSFEGRDIGRRQGKLGELASQFTPRNAVHPIQALQNYATGIVAARMTRVIVVL
jgi:hypothetical protein